MVERDGVSGDKIARIVIPLALAAWVGGMIISNPHAPKWATPVFVVVFGGAILAVLLWGFSGSSFGQLARRYPVKQPYTGTWEVIPTLHVSSVRMDQPNYNREKVRFVSSICVGWTDTHMYFTSPLAKIPFFNLLIPPAQVPLVDVKTLRSYDSSGFVQPASNPGTIIQFTFDPNFKGPIAEMQIGEPPIYVQMQSDVLEPAIAHLPAMQPSTSGT